MDCQLWTKEKSRETLHGAKGIKKCFEQSLARLYPDYVDVTPENILNLIKENQFVDTSRIQEAANNVGDSVSSDLVSDAFMAGLDDF